MTITLKSLKSAKANFIYVAGVVALIFSTWGQITAAADKAIADVVDPIIDSAIDAFKEEVKEQRAEDQKAADAIQEERDRAQDLQNQQIQSMYDHMLGGG